MKPEWVREVRDQCIDTGIASFFFKQWGGSPTEVRGARARRPGMERISRDNRAMRRRRGMTWSRFRDYEGREQSYVKHVFLERYLERLVHKTASSYPHIVYVDGFAGPGKAQTSDLRIRPSA